MAGDWPGSGSAPVSNATSGVRPARTTVILQPTSFFRDAAAQEAGFALLDSAHCRILRLVAGPLFIDFSATKSQSASRDQALYLSLLRHQRPLPSTSRIVYSCRHG